jgi:hypothetical protein
MSATAGFNQVEKSESEVISQGREACYSADARQGVQSKFGLAFSGGGIRSATFNLGVLQGLAEAKLLKRLDYLSTVSGGGYIGSWFSALLHRKAAEEEGTAAHTVAAALDQLQHELAPNSQPATAPHAGGKAAPSGQSAIKWLRRYSSYLTPHFGLFSLDTLAAVAGLFRNLLLNLTILVCLLMATLVVPYALMDGGRWIAANPDLFPFGLSAAAALLPLLIAVLLVQRGMTRHDSRNALPAVLFALLGSITAAVLLYLNQRLGLHRLGAFAGGAAVLYSLIWLVSPVWKNWRIQVWAALSGIAFGLMLFGYGKLLEYVPGDLLGAFSLVLGPPIVLQILCMAAILHTGLAGRAFTEINREWLGRAGGQVIALDLAWISLTALALFSPAVVNYLDAWVAYSGGAAWALGSIASFWMAGGSKSGGSTSNPRVEKGLSVAPYLVMLGLLVLLSTGLHRALTPVASPTATSNSQLDKLTVTIKDQKIEKVEASPATAKPTLHEHVAATLEENAAIKASTLAAAWAGLLAIGLLLAWRVDINVFSMHQFYRNRLARAYLGASNPERNPNPFTDFDESDDLPLSALAGQRPIHLVNTTLNLTEITDSELQWQERRGASFIFSPHYCGYELSPRHQYYVPTSQYMQRPVGTPSGVALGTTVAVSGAAASPNMGYHSSPPLAFLMTFFNVRLGRWCPNPANGRVDLLGPSFGLGYLLRELFGATNETTRFVNITDGGHFENLAVYELVRRKCKLIIVSDAEADTMAGFKFEGLGNVIHKCRVDFGVEIEMFGMDKLKPREAESRMALGRIKYGAKDEGVLVYIKPMLRGNEPVDVTHYAAVNQDFPHQSTGDQWFDESQFESYRELGLLTAREMLQALAIEGDDSGLGTDAFVNQVVAQCMPFISPAEETTV